MHVITQKRIWDAKVLYPTVSNALDGWYRIIKSNDFLSFNHIKKVFPSVDKVGKYHVFDIGGNKLRLIAVIDYKFKKLFIREILAHSEYDKNKWNK
ncbi:type II toxin-antitoxin system HigB family toxin [Thiotrichales bacterium 19S3-7]|nr:type II toxin-antitoxin system HigB family toxin [Thiotrichales bacterium 19S3-7]MCF6802603.1 type II toxin-antitoxin system HigB family toxin [Thiotrichales bacterium 19S3-11]